MRVAFLVRILVMNAVRGYPEDRAAFQSERGADRQTIFEPLGSPIAAVRQQAVIAHADSQAARNPVKKERDEKRIPREEEQRRYGADVKQHHEGGSDPIDPAVAGRLFPYVVECH